MYRVARSVTGAEADASVPTWPGPYPTITAYIAKQNQMPVRTTEPTRATGTFRRGRCTSSATVVEDSKPKKANTTKMNASPMPDRPDGELPGFQACGTCPCAPPLTRMGLRSLGRHLPWHPRPARAGHGALRRDQPAVAAWPGQALVPVPARDRCAFTTIDAGALALTRFSRFLGACHPEVGEPSAITRPVLEDYLSWLVTEGYSASTRALSLSMIRV